MYRHFNPNPDNISVGDCAVRAICAALNLPWEDVYMELAVCGLKAHDMPSANRVWGGLLRDCGFARSGLPDTCPDCYTVADFCGDHPEGVFVLATGTHIVTAINGDYYDAWDSGNEIPAYYWSKMNV